LTANVQPSISAQPETMFKSPRTEPFRRKNK
jgi:hypothetical protein